MLVRNKSYAFSVEKQKKGLNIYPETLQFFYVENKTADYATLPPIVIPT
jgi:hypothetical protein